MMTNVYLRAYHTLCSVVTSVYNSNSSSCVTQWNVNMSLAQLFESLDPYCFPMKE